MNRVAPSDGRLDAILRGACFSPEEICPLLAGRGGSLVNWCKDGTCVDSKVL